MTTPTVGGGDIDTTARLGISRVRLLRWDDPLVATNPALAAGRWCPTCARDLGYGISTSIGDRGTCHAPTDLTALTGATS